MEGIQATGISQTPKAIVARTNKDFVESVCSGYLTYFYEYQRILLSDRNLYTFLVNSILDVQGSDLLDVGYCTGWIEDFLEDSQILQ